MRRWIVGSVVLAVAVCGMGLIANADDVNPPPWWLNENSLASYWEEQTPGAGDLPAASSNFLVNWGNYPLYDEDFGGGPGQPWLVDDGQGYLEFYMPNFVDPLPLKWMRIQLTYSGQEPFVEWIDGFDAIDPVMTTGPLNHVYDTPYNPLAEAYFYKDWLLEPNPDWEIVYMQLPPGSILHQVVINSWSNVPAPSAFLIWSLGLLVLLLYRHRCKR